MAKMDAEAGICRTLTEIITVPLKLQDIRQWKAHRIDAENPRALTVPLSPGPLLLLCVEYCLVLKRTGSYNRLDSALSSTAD